MTEEFKIAEHKFVPQHSKLSEDERTKLLEALNTTAIKLPNILLTDSAIKTLEPHVGDIIKIERVSPTTGNTIFYRRVING
jgi:DNA-directed RNA polymerase subunit H